MKKYYHQDFQILELGSPGTSWFWQLVEALCLFRKHCFVQTSMDVQDDQVFSVCITNEDLHVFLVEMIAIHDFLKMA